MPIKNFYMLGSMLLCISLCLAHISGNLILLTLVLVAFLGLLVKACMDSYTLPVLLFFIPWSSILRYDLKSFSFYTIGLLLVTILSLIKTKLSVKRPYIVAGIALLLVTLVAKLLNGYFLSFSYVAFMFLIVFIPIIKEEYKNNKYDFFVLVLFLSFGTAVAALCAKQFANSNNIGKFINVHSYLNITRMTGFYNDPNFYAAQITAALGGCFFLLLKQEEKKRMLGLSAIIIVLLYCGALSGSKSFVVILGAILLLWIFENFIIRGKIKAKIIVAIGAGAIAVYIASSALFGGLIDVIITRFSSSTDFNSFTTGRLELWINYTGEMFGNIELLLLGQGYTSVFIGEKSTHNTLLQIVYQFGLIGSPFIATWIVFFYKDSYNREKFDKKQIFNVLMILTGVFLPWMAIDILFFDEFFLFQMYVFVGLQEMRKSVPEKNTYSSVNTQEKKRKLRFVWR